MNLTGSQYLAKALRSEGVDLVFGYPGGAVLEIFDSLAEAGMRHVITRHEQGAAFAADGYARATGRVGVCVATSGPGATNLVTGLAGAHMDSVPVVAITGQVYSRLLGTDAFQEADTFGITIPVTKHNFLVRSPDELPLTIKQAFHIANTGRKGPVVVDVTRDAAQGTVKAGPPAGLELAGYRPTEEGHPLQLRRAIEALLRAKRPLILAGGGVISSGTSEAVRELAETAGAPVATSLMGIGILPSGHPLNLGMLGMHGTPWANWAASECDLIVSLGMRFDDRATGKLERFAPDATVVHVDVDPAEIGKLRRASVPVVADLATALPALCELLRRSLSTRPARDEASSPPGDESPETGGPSPAASAAGPHHTGPWLDAIRLCRGRARWPAITHAGPGLHPADVIIELGKATGGQAILVADVGQNQMWAAQLFPVQSPRKFLTSGGLGAMGYALPAAVGAQFGCPDDSVIVIVGDGGLQMTIAELATVADHGLPLKIFVLNNGCLGMVRQWQELFFDGRYVAVKLGCPDLLKLADAYGLQGRRLSSPDGLEAAVGEALSVPGPVLVDCQVQSEANVWPIVPPGKGIDQAVDPSQG
jgi:acetolactate synthase-1/2/3 large subunit